MTTEALIRSVSIDGLVAKREAIAERLAEAARLIEEAGEIGNSVGDDVRVQMAFFSDEWRTRYRDGWMAEHVERVMRVVDGAMWGGLMSQSGILSYLDAAARDEWRESIRKGEHPPFDPATIKGTFARLYEDRGEMFSRGVVNLFRGLSWDYKTNCPRALGRRIVIKHFRDGLGLLGVDKLDDLTRALCVLDGKPEPDQREGWGKIMREAGVEHYRPNAGEVTSGYLRVRWFKKGTAHVEVLRIDLLDELNRIIAKACPHVLPAHAGAS